MRALPLADELFLIGHDEYSGKCLANAAVLGRGLAGEILHVSVATLAALVRATELEHVLLLTEAATSCASCCWGSPRRCRPTCARSSPRSTPRSPVSRSRCVADPGTASTPATVDGKSSTGVTDLVQSEPRTVSSRIQEAVETG